MILHQGNRFDRKAGDKIELVETGPMSVLEMVSTIGAVYKTDPMEMRVMRLDLAADNRAVPVEWFRNNSYALSKQVMREWAVQTISSRRAETLTCGNKPNQYRIYDKTGHRKVLLAAENRKLEKCDKHIGMTFQERWGYSPTDIVTRVERQIGGKAALDRFGYTKVGNLYELDKSNPFTQLVFPKINGESFTSCVDEELSFKHRFARLTPEQRVMADYLRNIAVRDGITHAKNHLHRMCKARTQFYRLWKRYEPFVMIEDAKTPETRINQETLRKAFLVSMRRQLKRAA